MPQKKIKRKSTKKKAPKKISKNIKESLENFEEETEDEFFNTKIDTSLMVSTGSTLLDLAISGGVSEYGGVPGGIMCEFFGGPGTGKTAILAEMSGSVQAKGGEVFLRDPEARLNKEYCRIYGVDIEGVDYDRPNVVTEIFDDIMTWSPKNSEVINLFGVDGTAALSTIMEMDKEDKMGMKRAKDFSAGCRKTARLIAKESKLIVFTNQIRTGNQTKVTPGGFAVPFYSSLRVELNPTYPNGKLERQRTVHGNKIKKVIGINTTCRVIKSSIDEPFREAPIYIVFGYGVDDIRANLQFVKDYTKATKYDCFEREYQAMDNAIAFIEEKKFQQKLKDRVVEVWNEIEKAFKIKRKPKARV